MNSKKESRSLKITVRFTNAENKILDKRIDGTIYKDTSTYIRTVLFGKPVIVKSRNQSFDDCIEELAILRQQLNAIGNNFNQAVKKLHTIRQIPEFRSWASAYEDTRKELEINVRLIKEKINQISDKWLQE